MKIFRRTLLITGIILCLSTIVSLIILHFQPNTYVNIALSNVLVMPFVYGISLLLLFVLFRKRKRSFANIIEYLFLIIMLIFLISANINEGARNALKDFNAAIQDDLLVMEGSVLESTITRESVSSTRSKRKRYNYFQEFTIDSLADTRLFYQVTGMDNPIFEKEKSYRFTMFPYSKEILAYEELD